MLVDLVTQTQTRFAVPWRAVVRRKRRRSYIRPSIRFQNMAALAHCQAHPKELTSLFGVSARRSLDSMTHHYPVFARSFHSIHLVRVAARSDPGLVERYATYGCDPPPASKALKLGCQWRKVAVLLRERGLPDSYAALISFSLPFLCKSKLCSPPTLDLYIRFKVSEYSDHQRQQFTFRQLPSHCLCWSR
jgi:hypothetical protein